MAGGCGVVWAHSLAQEQRGALKRMRMKNVVKDCVAVGDWEWNQRGS